MTADAGLYGGRKTREGTVVSDKMENTVVVAVQTSRRHPLYKKTIRRVHKFMAHDASGDTRLGDVVRIVEISPVSKRKRWGVVEVLKRAELPELAPGSIDLEIIGEVKAETPEEEVPAVAVAAEDVTEAATDVPEPVDAEEAPVAAAEPEVGAEPQAGADVSGDTEGHTDTDAAPEAETIEGTPEDDAAPSDEEEPK